LAASTDQLLGGPALAALEMTISHHHSSGEGGCLLLLLLLLLL
jgi:hypothetical protein